jgi:ribonuclease P protein component
MRFRPAQHLRRPGEIRAVREQGRRIDCRAFTVWWKHRSAALAQENAPVTPRAPAPSTARVCVIASTAAVGGAIQRNRAKRRLREIFRQHQDLVPPTCDLLLIARSTVTTWDILELQKRFSEACAQIRKS